MDIPLGAEVHCTDKKCGKATAAVINPIDEEITHIVVRTGDVLHEEYLVPVDLITESTTSSIHIRISQAELARCQPYKAAVLVGSDTGDEEVGEAVDASLMYWPYVSPDLAYDEIIPDYEMHNQVPARELLIHRGASVKASDGTIGKVDEFLINPANNHITHLVMRSGHLWGQKDVTIPLSHIDHVEEDVVFLNINKKAVTQLPAIPVRRR